MVQNKRIITSRLFFLKLSALISFADGYFIFSKKTKFSFVKTAEHFSVQSPTK
jgi:hypothetical protein